MQFPNNELTWCWISGTYLREEKRRDIEEREKREKRRWKGCNFY
jgi:hypothetical protein